jgi:hypothetical protein
MRGQNIPLGRSNAQPVTTAYRLANNLCFCLWGAKTCEAGHIQSVSNVCWLDELLLLKPPKPQLVEPQEGSLNFANPAVEA